MAMWVQANNGNLSSMTWYRADEIEWDVNYLWPFNNKGSNKGYMEIRSSSYPLYIYFTPLNEAKLQGIILGLYAGSSSTNYDRDVKVELEESTDGGSTWTSVRDKTLNFPNDISAGPEKQYGKFIVDFRFDTSYSLNTSNQYRFKIYRVGSGTGTLYLQLSKDSSWSSWQSDISDYAFRIIYSNSTGIPSDSDVFVITDELVIDQNWTVGYVTIPTSPSKSKLDSYNNKGSFWITSKGRLYIPSNITSDITVEVKGRMYFSGGDRVAWQIGDSEANPIPADKTVNWYFNCEGTSRRAGIYGYRSAWTKVEHYGSPIEKWYAILKYDADKNTNQIVVEGDVTSEWKVGDKISIGGMKYSSTRHLNDFQRDVRFYEISSLSYDSINDETTITLTENLSYMREATARVLLVRRNVNVYGNSSISSTNNMADTYIYYIRWWRAHWVRYAYMRYPAYFEGYNPKISLANYPHIDILKGILIHDCHYFYIRYRKGGQIEKAACCMERSSGWSWGDGGIVFYKSNGFTVNNIVGIIPYFVLQISQSSGNEVSNLWVQGQYGIYLYLSSGNKIHDGTVFNSRYGVLFSGASRNEIYDIYMKNIYYDSNDLPTDTSIQGCFYYSGDMLSQDNYIHDITIENAFSIFAIDIDDGCADWYHNIVYSNITTEFYTVYRNDWLNDTRIRFTKRNGIENNDWIIYKYGEVHKTGDYENADDTLHRTDFGGKFALRLEPKVEEEEFKDYKILLTGAKKGKPVSYVGYVYVKSGYFDGDYELPEIYLEGCGIDYNSEPSAKWTHPGSSYADQWVSFTVIGTPQEDGNVYAVIRLKSNGSEPHFYIDDDIYTWTESIDWRGHEIWIEGQPAYPPAKFPVLTAMEIWEQPTNVLTAENTIGKLVVDMNDEVENHRNTVEPKIDTTISSRASQESVDAIPTNPLLDNDPRLDNLDATISSRLASNDSRLDNLDAPVSSRSSHTPADVWSYSTRELTNPDNYKADVSNLAKESTVQSIKNQTDKLKFNAENDVIATLDGEVVNLTSETESQIDNIEANVTNPGQYKADVSNLALQSTLEQVKAKTDKLQFDDNSFVKANAQNPELSNLDTTVSSRASQTSVDAIPTNPLLDNDPRLDNLDATISSRSSHTPADVWNYSNRSLTSSVSLTDSDKDDIADKVWDEPVSEHVTSGTFGEKNQNKVPSENVDDYKADVANLALQSTLEQVKTKTDKLQFDENNNVKSVAQNEELANLDTTVSSRASQSSVDSIINTLSTLVSDIWSYSTRTLTSFGNLVSDIWSYVTRTLTGKVFIEDSDKEEIVDKVWDEPIAEHVAEGTFGQKNQRAVPSENIDDYKADVSDLAKESTVQSIKSQTDKIKFDAENDVIATLDGEKVSLTDETESQIDNTEAAVNQIKSKTDNLPDNPASTTDITDAKDAIINEVTANRNLINELLDIEEGNWEIKNNQMIFYKRDGTELMRFNLYNKNNQPAETNVYKREKV